MNFIRIRNTGSIVVILKNRVIKIPFNKSAINEHKRECIARLKAEDDTFFKKFLPKWHTISDVIFTQRLCPVTDLSMITAYFKQAFKDRAKWAEEKLVKLITVDDIQFFLKKYSSNDVDFFLNIINRMKINVSSSHGDFQQENILSLNDRLYFIDWNEYSILSSRYFDLINYHVVGNKLESWVHNFVNQYNDGKLEKLLQYFDGHNDYAISYAFWRMARELRFFFYKSSSVPKLQKDKYLFILDFIKKLVE
ncbi:MAG: hypothetical protein K8R68_02790 [Bacteroidales bacterium]|nr:hypothetical protein [Bacteroidales bacterium]